MILPSQASAAKVAIKRFGETVSITEPVDDDNAVNGYGKKAEDSWNEVATESVVLIYSRGTRPGQSRTSGGRYRTESPLLIFAPDSDIEEGFRVTHSGKLYEIDTLLSYPSHFEAETTVVE